MGLGQCSAVLLGVSMGVHTVMEHDHLNSYPDKAVRLAGERAARALDHDVSGIVARPAALMDVFASQQLRQEAAHEGITSAVCVH